MDDHSQPIPELPHDLKWADVRAWAPAIASANGTFHYHKMAEINPILPQRADPHVMLHTDGYYYLTPVFKSNAATSQFGPGHNSFATSPDGKTDIIVYHSRNYEKRAFGSSVPTDPAILGTPAEQFQFRDMVLKSSAELEDGQSSSSNDIFTGTAPPSDRDPAISSQASQIWPP